MDTFEIREKVSKAAAMAFQQICAELGYICVFSGEIACFVYGGSRPPTNVEAVIIMPGICMEAKPSNDKLKRLIADFPTNSPNGGFELKDSTILSFTHARFTGQWKAMVVEVYIASTLEERDVQPIWAVDGLPYACAEYVLSARLSLWSRAHNAIKQTNSTKEVQTMHRNREIDPLLEHLVKTNTSIAKWRQLGITRVVEYCKSYPSSSDLWFKIGLDPKLREFATPDSPATATPSDLQDTIPATSTPARIAQAFNITDPPNLTTKDVLLQLDDIKNSSRVQLISLAAQRVVYLLQSMDIPSAIFGSLACFMYGSVRSPDDVDILVLPPPSHPLGSRRTIKGVKAALVQIDPEHFLLAPADAASGQKVLHYCLSGSKSPLTTASSCKIKLACPSTSDLLYIPSSVIHWDEGLPLIPFSLLLLYKLQSWSHHDDSPGALSVIRKKREAEDLKGMLELDLMEELGRRQPWFDRRLFGSTFVEDSAVRVRGFCSMYPEFLAKWRATGFRP